MIDRFSLSTKRPSPDISRSRARRSLRRLRRHPLVSIAIVLALAVGTAAALATFDFTVDGAAAPHPVVSPEGLRLPLRITPLISADSDPTLAEPRGGMGTGGRDAITLGTIADIQAEGVRGLLLLAAGAGVILLLVTCVNVALLLFSAGKGRSQELTMRSILGARRGRLLTQMLGEQAPVILLSTILGAAFFALFRVGLRESWPTSLDAWLSAPISPTVLSVVVALPLITVASFAILPVLLLRERALGGEVAGGTRITANPHEALLRDRATVLGIGMSITLMTSAGLLLKGFSAQLEAPAYPFSTHDTLTFSIKPADPGISPEESVERVDRLLKSVEALPGVSAVAFGSEGAWLGLGTTALAHSLTGVPTRPGFTRPARYISVTTGGLTALGFTIERGRDFTALDRSGGTAAVIVNRTFANRFFFGDPVGRAIQLGRPDPNGIWFSVVGVVEDFRPVALGNGAEPQPMLILSAAQVPLYSFDMVARFIGDPLAARLQIEKALTTALPDAAIVYTGTLAERSAAFSYPLAWFGAIVAVLAGFTTLLSGFDLYSMIEFNVVRRTRELGVRSALGARSRDIIALVLRDGSRLASRGCVLGLAGASCAGRLLQFTFAGVEAVDPSTYAAALALTLLIAVVASYFPARAALRVDPVTALAHD